jgi:CRP-like cAMP-binding protein
VSKVERPESSIEIAKLTVISKSGKEATIALISAKDFVGEESIAGPVGLRLTTATAITACTALKIEREEIICVLHEEHAFSDLFLTFLLARGTVLGRDPFPVGVGAIPLRRSLIKPLGKLSRHMVGQMLRDRLGELHRNRIPCLPIVGA